mmetsp:Transcript_22974/g.58267  ORF Transcript_22974/g.58267 Transcript_22974/m.58267 type:complete len:88 (-) Transcript_22974:318-581(-)
MPLTCVGVGRRKWGRSVRAEVEWKVRTVALVFQLISGKKEAVCEEPHTPGQADAGEGSKENGENWKRGPTPASLHFLCSFRAASRHT